MNINFIIKHINPNLIADFDPLNHPRTVSCSRFSYDEVHPDAEEIIGRLLEATTEAQAKVIKFEWFGKYFGVDILGDDWDSLKDGVLDLWRYYCR